MSILPDFLGKSLKHLSEELSHSTLSAISAEKLAFWRTVCPSNRKSLPKDGVNAPHAFTELTSRALMINLD